jgi:hypothetical protein
VDINKNNPLPERWARPWRNAGNCPFTPQRTSARPPWHALPRGEAGARVSCPQKDKARAQAKCLWISQIGDSVVGLVRLVEAGPGTARIVMFRIDPDWYHTPVVANLVKAVADYCRRQGRFKVLVDFGVAPPWMPSILRRHGFQVLWRSHTWEAILDP